MTDHHRRPQSRGGKRTYGNIYRVVRYKHESYHLLFDSFAVPDMVKRFQFYFDLFGDSSPRTTDQNTYLQNWIRGERQRDRDGRIKRQAAWNNLFARMTIADILIEINNCWLDYAWRIVKVQTASGKILFVTQKILASARTS
ncbi:MAG: hypothetical protein WCQ60_02830 [bacterium]